MSRESRRMPSSRAIPVAYGLWLALALAGCATRPAPMAPVAAAPVPAGDALRHAIPAPSGTPPPAKPAVAAPPTSAAATVTANSPPEVVPPEDHRNTVYFPLNSYTLSSQALKVLKRHAQKLDRNRRLIVTLVGHTDDLGSREFNDALCLKRARAVKRALLKLGVAPRQIRIAARYGYEKVPVKPCDTEACRKVMRNVELHYLD